MNLSPFYDILEELQANISSLREEAVRINALIDFIFCHSVIIDTPVGEIFQLRASTKHALLSMSLA